MMLNSLALAFISRMMAFMDADDLVFVKELVSLGDEGLDIKLFRVS